MAMPVPVALVAIPALIAGMGQERFGILTIAWALMGYFGVFDLGLSRATTTYMARALHDRDDAAARRIYWSSTSAHLVLGVVGGATLALMAPFVERSLTIDQLLRSETRWTLYLLALSVPIVLLTSVTRGLLEALHRFDLVNAVKVPASVVTYLGPLLALPFTDRLPPIVIVILLARTAVLVSYAAMCARVLPSVRTFERPRLSALKPLAVTGGWITVGTILVPLVVTIDRYVLGAVVSVGAVAVYAAPYEVVTKLWMFSASLMGVLFPRFSVLTAERHARTQLYLHAMTTLVLVATPVAALMIAFAPEFFTMWLGPDIARDGVVVARWLTIGVLVSVLAQVPNTALQASGHADAPGKLQLAQVPVYAVGAWFAAVHWGVMGVAIAWAARAAVDAVALFVAAYVRLELGPNARPSARTAVIACASVAMVLWGWVGVPALTSALPMKAALVFVGIGATMATLLYLLRVEVLRLRTLAST